MAADSKNSQIPVTRDLRIWRDKQGQVHVEELPPQVVRELPPRRKGNRSDAD